MTEERNGISPEDNPTMRNTKSSFAKVSRHFRPKFRGNSLLVTHHLSYFEPIRVPKDILLRNGVLDEIITVNPLTGVVEVITTFMFSQFSGKTKYKKPYRIWTLNEPARKALSRHMEINIGTKLYSKCIPDIDLDGSDEDINQNILLFNRKNEGSSFSFGLEISRCIKDDYIDEYISASTVKYLTIKEPIDNYKSELLNFQSSERTILASRDIRLDTPNFGAFEYHVFFDDKKMFIVVGLNKFSSNDNVNIIKVKYSFKPKTDDLVEYYEKLKSGELYNKVLSPDIYVDDLLSDRLYDPSFLEILNGGADKHTEFSNTRYGISIGDDNSIIKPISLLTWIPPVKPIPDPYFQYRLSSMYTMNGFFWLRSSLFDTRVYSKRNNYAFEPSSDWFGYNPQEYNATFLNIVNNGITGVIGGYLNLFSALIKRKENNYPHYDIDSVGIDPYNKIRDYMIVAKNEMNSGEYINDGYFYKDAILNYNDLSNNNKYHIFGTLGSFGIHPSSNGGADIVAHVHKDSYPNASLDASGRDLLLYNHFNERITDFSRLVFRGGGWILNNLFATDPLVTGNSQINLTPINKFVIDYYNERKLNGLKPFTDKESVVRGLRLSDGISPEEKVNDSAFDEEIPSIKTNTYSFPLASQIENFDNVVTMPSIAGWLETEFTSENHSTSNLYYNPYRIAMEQIDKLEPILSAEDLNEGKFKLHRYLNIDNPENTESGDDLNRKYVRHMVYRPDDKVLENNKKIGLYDFEGGNSLREQLEMGTYRYGQFVYSDPAPINLSEIFPNNKRENVLESESINQHNFLFNIPLGSSNYMGDRLLKDKVPIDRRDNRPKDFADFPFNRMLPKMLNTYDAVDKSWFAVWTSGYIQETSIKDDYYKNNSDNYSNVNKVLLTNFHYRGVEPGINLHKTMGDLVGWYNEDERSYFNSKIVNHVFLKDTLTNTSYEPDYNLFSGLTGIAERMSLVYSLSPEKLLSDDRYWDNSYIRYGKIGPDEEHIVYNSKDKGLSNKYNGGESDNDISVLNHPVYLYVLGGYETLYNRYHEYKMYRALRYGEKTQEVYEYTIDREELFKYGHLLFSAPPQLQTATAFALATGINSYFYTPNPACGLLDYYKKVDDGSSHSTYSVDLSRMDNIVKNVLLKYTPTLPTYLSGLSPLYQIFNLKNTLGNYTKFKEFSNKGLDLFMDRMESLEAVKNVVSYKPVNYHHLITDESYPEVARCLTAFLLADWCNIKITDGAGNVHQYKRINNFMVKYDINGDDITVNNRPIVEDIGTKGTSMRHIITDVWGKRPEDVYNDEVIDIRKLHGGMGFSISGISKRTRLIDNIENIGNLFGYMNFCTPCLPFGGDTFELAYVTENYNTVRLDYVDDIYKQDGIYNRSCFEHYSPNCFARNKELTENDPNNEKYKAYIDHLAQLNKLMLDGMTTIYDVKDDRAYKDSIYKNIVIDSEETPFLDMGNRDTFSINSSPGNKWYSAGGTNADIVLEFHFNPIFGVPGNKVSFGAGASLGSKVYRSRLDGIYYSD